MKPRTTTVGAKEQNGDVEAANGVLKRALEQSLLLRGSRDFESAGMWQSFVDDVMRKANRARGRRLAEDVEAMRPLNVARLPEFVEEPFCVGEWSTVRVKHCAYSVPSRLIGEWVRVRIFEARIELRHIEQHLRLRGQRGLRLLDEEVHRAPGGRGRLQPERELLRRQGQLRLAQQEVRGGSRGRRRLHLEHNSSFARRGPCSRALPTSSPAPSSIPQRRCCSPIPPRMPTCIWPSSRSQRRQPRCRLGRLAGAEAPGTRVRRRLASSPPCLAS